MTPPCGLGLQNQNGLLKFTSGCDLISVNTFPLCSFVKITRTCSCMSVQYQNDHLDMVLQTKQENHDARFRNWLPLMLKVGIR